MDRKRLTKRQLQARKTQSKIYQSSLMLMREKGFENVTIEDISKKAGVSVGSFYRYYKSKEVMFFEIYRLIDEYFEKNVTSELLGNGLSAPEQIEKYFRHYAIYITDKDLETTSQLYNTGNKLFTDKKRYMLVLLRDIITKGQEKGEISRKMPPDRMTEYCLMIGRGVVFDWCLHRGEYSLEETMMHVIKWLVNDLKEPVLGI